jgi:hypothetical protein
MQLAKTITNNTFISNNKLFSIQLCISKLILKKINHYATKTLLCYF